MINLEDVKVSHEGQTLPAINLIGTLQTQLREAASRIAAIAETLGDLQTALLNSHTVEVKLTLSMEDYNKFQSLRGIDDNERIRKAVMNVIHPETANISPGPDIPIPSTTYVASAPAPSTVEPPPVTTKAPEPIPPPEPEPQAVEQTFPERPFDAEIPIKKKLITKCPTCQWLIELPETTNDLWPIELKCGNCGAKCLLKPSFRKP